MKVQLLKLLVRKTKFMGNESKDQKKKADVYLGVQIELNSHTVDLAPSTPINKIDEKGLKLGLKKAVKLGTLEKALPSIFDDLGIKSSCPVDEKTKKLKSTGVEFLDKIGDKVMNADLTIHALEYERSPSPQKEDGTFDPSKAESKYAFVASATWTEPAEKSDDFFKLKGIVVGVVSGYSDAESSEAFSKVVAQMNMNQIAPAATGKLLPTTEKPQTEIVSEEAVEDSSVEQGKNFATEGEASPPTTKGGKK